MSDYRDDYRNASRGGRWLLPRVSGWFIGLFFLGLLIGVIMLIGTIGFGWFSGEANLRSFNHVRATYQEAFDDVKSMEANVRQACRFKQQVAEAKASGDTSTANQRETQLLTIQNNYDRIKGEYEAYMSDHFRGGVIRPQQLPMPYPTIDNRMAATCP